MFRFVQMFQIFGIMFMFLTIYGIAKKKYYNALFFPIKETSII